MRREGEKEEGVKEECLSRRGRQIDCERTCERTCEWEGEKGDEGSAGGLCVLVLFFVGRW